MKETKDNSNKIYKWIIREENGIVREMIYEMDENGFVNEEEVIKYLFSKKSKETLYELEQNEDYLPEISDIYLEALLCHGMNEISKSYGENKKEKIYSLMEFHFLMKEYLYHRKALLAEIYETNNLEEKYKEFNKRVSDFVQDCKDVYKDKNYKADEKWKEIKTRNKELLEDEEFSSGRKEIIANIGKRISKERFPYYWLEKLVMTLDETTVKRRTIVRLLQESKVYHPSESMDLTVQMILDNDKYKEYTNDAKRIHCKITEAKMNIMKFAAIIKTNNWNNAANEFKNICNDLRDYINTCNEISKLRNRYRESGKGCYGLLRVGDRECFAFSGPFDIDTDDQELVGFFKVRNNKFEKYKKLVEAVEKLKRASLFGNGNVEWARTNYEMKRYAAQIAENIPEGESLRSVIDNPRKEENAYMDFRCCERKIFKENIGAINEKCYLFTKYLPCSLCRPAIRELKKEGYKIEVYYLDENGIQEWEDLWDVHKNDKTADEIVAEEKDFDDTYEESKKRMKEQFRCASC